MKSAQSSAKDPGDTHRLSKLAIVPGMELKWLSSSLLAQNSRKKLRKRPLQKGPKKWPGQKNKSPLVLIRSLSFSHQQQAGTGIYQHYDSSYQDQCHALIYPEVQQNKDAHISNLICSQ